MRRYSIRRRRGRSKSMWYDVDHRPRMGAADAEVEATGCEFLQRLSLGDEGQWVPGEGGDDRGAEGDALRLHGGRAEQRERVERSGRHHHPGVVDIRPLGADAEIDDRFGASAERWRCRPDPDCSSCRCDSLCGLSAISFRLLAQSRWLNRALSCMRRRICTHRPLHALLRPAPASLYTLPSGQELIAKS